MLAMLVTDSNAHSDSCSKLEALNVILTGHVTVQAALLGGNEGR